MIFQTFLIVLSLIALAVLGLSVGILIKGKFPETHIEHNKEMQKRGIRCAKLNESHCSGRPDDKACEGCFLSQNVK